MKKRMPKLAAGSLILAAIASYWLWLAPGGAPGCDGTAACTSSAPLELSALDFDVDSIQRRAVALSPDGNTAVVLARGESAEDEPFEAAIASFDVASGAHIRTYLSQELLSFEELAFSPDGSILVASYTAAETTRALDGVHLFDVASGESRHLMDTICGYSLGVSADNTMLQCQSTVFDIASGDVVTTAQDRLGIHSLGDYVFTNRGQADLRRDELRLADKSGRPIPGIPYPDIGAQRDVQLQGTLDGSKVLYLARPKSQSQWTPRPQRIEGWLLIFDVTRAEHVATYELDATPVAVAVTNSGTAAVVIDDDFRMQSFSLAQTVNEAE